MNIETPIAKGIVRLDFRDAETGEILRTHEQENAITFAGLWSTIMTGNGDGHLPQASNAQATGEWIYVTDRITSDGLVTGNRAIAKFPTHLTRASINQQEWTFFEGSPDYSEKVNRFNPPGANITINSIYLSSDNTLNCFAVAALNTPCVQTTSEVLDVTYRIQWLYQTQNPASLIQSSSFGRAIGNKTTNESIRSGGFPENTSFMWCDVPPVDHYGLVADGVTVASGASHLVRKTQYKNEMNLNKSISSDIGRVIRSVGYGVSSASFFENNRHYRTVAWAPIAPDSFVNKPIQTIHNHSSGAIEWGLDVDFLSTGQGSLTLDGSSWTDPDWPQFYRIDHSLSGQVATSRYSFRKRPTLGFQGNTYESQRIAPIYNQHVTSSSLGGNRYSTVENEDNALVNTHGFNAWKNLEEYDKETIITWDSTGIAVNNLNDCHLVYFDTTTTPSLPVSGVQQCAVDASGNIWIAASSGGLFKLTDPFGSPTITKMTIASNTLPVGGEDNCYAVARANGGDIMALVEGGLIRSTNPTGATPLFVTETFSFTGISDNNWGTVLYMMIDEDSTVFELALIAEQNLPALNQRVVWWSTSQVAIIGPNSSAFSINTSTNKTKYGRVRCSRFGSLWCRHGPAQANDQIQLLEFASTVAADLSSDAGARDVPIFFYDYYDTPHVGGATRAATDSFGIWRPGNLRSDDKNYGGHSGQTQPTNWFSYNGAHVAFQSEGGRGLWINHDTSSDTGGEDNLNPVTIKAMGPKIGEYMDPLNGVHSPHEECLWRRYGWNGAAWVENYFADATDTGTHAGGPYDANRHNFDVETHDFTGRSMIDVTAAFPANAYTATANATFVFTLIPIAKDSAADNNVESRQEKPRILLDLSDDTQQFQIVWDDDIQGNITIVEDGDGGTIIASTSANASTYRLVVTIAGTAVSVYLDGNTTPIGTVTLANAYDWDNTGSDLIAFLGCGVYNWSYPQRNTPWQNNFYRGEMKNVQFWNVAWNTTDVTNDFVDITAVIGSQPAANLVARYELTQSLATLETKLSHVAAETLDEGLTIAFANGGAPTAFIGNDYHTFGVVDGILKDNAIAFTQNFSIYYKPTDLAFSDFDNGASGTTIAASTTAITDEPAIFVEVISAVSDHTVANPTNDNRMIVAPGQIFQNQSVNASHTDSYGGVTVQPITGDGYFECESAVGDNWVTFGLTDNPSANHSSVNIEFGIRYRIDGSIDIVEDNVVVSAAIGTYVVGDVFRVRRIGTAITYYKNGVLIFTSGNTSSGTVYGRAHPTEEGYGITNAKITYTRPNQILTVGDPTGVTGLFDPDFLAVETLTVESISINIAGTPATVNVSNTYYDNMTAPGPGEVTINGSMGWLLFNVADVGSAITGDVTVIFNK